MSQPDLFDQQHPTFGPAYEPKVDAEPVRKQHATIRDWMLGHGRWRTLAEIAVALGYPEGSIGAQLRHLRKAKFGSYDMKKRRRIVGLEVTRVWEYRVRPAETDDDGG